MHNHDTLLLTLLRGQTPLVTVDTLDEPRLLSTAARCAITLKVPLYCWTSAKGLISYGVDAKKDSSGAPTAAKTEPLSARDMLKSLHSLPSPSIVVLCDLHLYLTQNNENVRYLKEAVFGNETNPRTLILVGRNIELPADLSPMVQPLVLPLPTEEELLEILKDEGARWAHMQNIPKIKVEQGVLQKLVRNLNGLSFSEARHLARQIIRVDSVLSEDDSARLTSEKFKLLGMEGVVSFEEDVRGFEAVGGLTKLKAWLEARKSYWHGQQQQDDRPRGVLLLGVQGGGKSLAARVIAGHWGLPLLQINAGALYNKYIGETERNLREALALADAMSPCVVWIDEVEKGFATDDNDGTSKRVLGTLLTWMAENKKKVFLIATANDVTRLPPELMRKGRIDEIFFVDLPNRVAREQIFQIHLSKRKIHLPDFDIPLLAKKTEGFSGAEIEQAIVSAGFSAKSGEEELTSVHLANEIGMTKPLSIVRAEEIAALRLWARERTVAAD